MEVAIFGAEKALQRQIGDQCRLGATGAGPHGGELLADPVAHQPLQVLLARHGGAEGHEHGALVVRHELGRRRNPAIEGRIGRTRLGLDGDGDAGLLDFDPAREHRFEQAVLRLVVIDDARLADAGFAGHCVNRQSGRTFADRDALGGVENLVGGNGAVPGH